MRPVWHLNHCRRVAVHMAVAGTAATLLHRMCNTCVLSVECSLLLCGLVRSRCLRAAWVQEACLL